jgi:hypothetical protein
VKFDVFFGVTTKAQVELVLSTKLCLVESIFFNAKTAEAQRLCLICLLIVRFWKQKRTLSSPLVII